MSSSSVANSGSGVANVAWSAAGAELRSTEGELTITKYEFPVHGKTDLAVDGLTPGFLRDARACIGWINSIPRSPFPTQMVHAVTGTPIGTPRLDA